MQAVFSCKVGSGCLTHLDKVIKLFKITKNLNP